MTHPLGAFKGKEDAFQISAIGFVRRMARANGHDPKCVMHVPNGGARSIVAGAKMKAAGVVRGYPDIMVFAPESVPPINRKTYVSPRCGLALELKVWPNKPSKDQELIHEILRGAGWRVVVCWSLDAVINECERYFRSNTAK